MPGRFNIDIKDALQQLKDAKTLSSKVTKPAADYMRSITPIRTGNARRNTNLRDTTITADYPYAERLDNGWSKQALDGMTAPTESELHAFINFIASFEYSFVWLWSSKLLFTKLPPFVKRIALTSPWVTLFHNAFIF